jgi:hypothetical protein
MRGAERPARVHWTHPFLEPLGPLSHEAARQTFTEIAEDFHDPKDIDQLLQFTDNMPLAVDLMAHLVDYGGCARVLAQWEVEKTSMLSAGHDRRSNLDASIALSLSSPRLSSLPGAIDLLSLLSILPDGLSNVELVQSNLPIPDILACKTVLIGTALAYHDDKKRLKSLVPIREYMQHFCPVAQSIIQPLQSHFHKLLKMHQEYNGSYQITDIVSQITLNSGNIHNVLQRGLTPQNPGLADAVACTFSLNSFSRLTGSGRHVLMDQIQAVLKPSDHILRVRFIMEIFNSSDNHFFEDAEHLASEAKSHLLMFNDPHLESMLSLSISFVFLF